MDDFANQPMTIGQDVNRPSVSFVPEILQMMHSFGDGPKCNPTSGHLIEEIVWTRMNSILIQCYTMAQMRNAAATAVPIIGLKELVLFLMKDGKNFGSRTSFDTKIVRLMKHFQLKDSIGNSSEMAFDTSSDGTNFDYWNTDPSVSVAMDSVNVHGQQKCLNKKKSSRIETCIKIIEELDSSGEILDTFNDIEYIDTVKMDRNVRIDQLTRKMSEEEYYKFSQSRNVSISNRTKLSKFKQWLLDGTTVTIDTFAMEAFQWMAHELVATIVDYCFLVQQEKNKNPTDAVQGSISCRKNTLFTMATANVEHSCADGINRQGVKRKYSVPENEPSLLYHGSITPADVREVSRRYFLAGGRNAFDLIKKHEPPRSRF